MQMTLDSSLFLIASSQLLHIVHQSAVFLHDWHLTGCKKGSRTTLQQCPSTDAEFLHLCFVIAPRYSFFILDQHCPCACLVTHLVKKPCRMEENLVQFLGWEDPLEEDMTTPSSLLAWRIPVDRGAWRAAVRGVTERQTGLSDYAQHGVVLSCCIV